MSIYLTSGMASGMSQSTLSQHSVDVSELRLKCAWFHAAEFSVVLKQTALSLKPLLCYVMIGTLQCSNIIIFLHFDIHSFAISYNYRHTFLAPERINKSISGPRPKKVVHPWFTSWIGVL